MKKLMLMGLLFIASWNDGHALTTVEIVAKVKPAIVVITLFDDNKQPLSLGTGFFISSNQIVTNSHVIRGGSYLVIQDLSGTYYKLNKVLDDNPTFDLAILQTAESGKTFLNFGNTKHLLEGQNILVIGNPEGHTGTVSVGIISAIRGDSHFQFTAPVSHGSSGSPVVDENGDVVGIVYQLDPDGQNLNFAITADLIEPARPRDKIAEISTSEEDKVAQLIIDYMNATQNGKPVSLAPYVTNLLYKWYGQKNVPRERAEKENVDYYRHWPNQTTSFDVGKLQIEKVDRNDIVLYHVQLPFSYFISNGKQSKQGNKVVNAYVILTVNGAGAGYRIMSIENF